MATIPTKPITDAAAVPPEGSPAWRQWRSAPPSGPSTFYPDASPQHSGEALPSTKEDTDEQNNLRPAGSDALQALLAFSALHQQVRRRRALAARHNGFEVLPPASEFDASEQFVLDEVLQSVAQHAVVITGADGLGIALAENNEIVLRASAGTIKPDVGARIERDSAFSGACFRTAQIIRCDDTETDDRVNLDACRKLGARSMVAVPLCGRRRVIGLLEAFSAEPFGFNDSDVASLELLAELILGALKPEDEDRFAESAVIAETALSAPAIPPTANTAPQAASQENPLPAISAPEVQIEPLQPQSVHSTTVGSEKFDSEKLDLEKLESEKIHTSPILLAPKLESASSIASPPPEVTVPLTAEPSTATQQLPESALTTEVAAEPPADRHPGMLLVLVLIVICALLAAGLWWKLKNAQLGGMLIKAEPQMSAKPKPSQKSAPAAPPSAPTSNPATNTQAPNGPTPNQPTLNEPTSSAASSPITDNDSYSATASTPTPREPGKLPRITGIRHWSAADSSTVVLDLEDQVQYEEHRLANPDRIYFDLHDTSLAPDLEGKTIEIGDALLIRVRVAQPVSGLTRVVLETRGNSNFSVSLEPNPYRLLVQIRKPGVNTTSQVSLFPRSPAAEETDKLAIVVPPPTREDLQLRARVAKMRIVVDPGHGGWDLGTVGRRGLLEKDVVLEIAQRLGKLLETRLGAEVIFTRKDDNYIPLDERAGMANQAQADLFVSVHANYSDLPSARGVETYYTNFFSAPNSKEVETRTNGTTNKNVVAAALSPADLHERIEQSRRLAASVQHSLYGTLSVQNPGLRDRGVKEASYVVLTETAMPGILAEVSFVSSPTDEQKLRSDGYREQIAEALYKGIARYAASGSPRIKMASAAK